MAGRPARCRSGAIRLERLRARFVRNDAARRNESTLGYGFRRLAYRRVAIQQGRASWAAPALAGSGGSARRGRSLTVSPKGNVSMNNSPETAAVFNRAAYARYVAFLCNPRYSRDHHELKSLV